MNTKTYEYEESLSGSTKEIYKLKRATAMLGHCPYKYPSGQWRNDPTKWPEVTWHDLSVYLIDSSGNDFFLNCICLFYY